MNKLFLIIGISLVMTQCTSEKKGPILLNNGTKWQINTEMTPFILEAETVFKNYSTQGNGDYKALAKALEDKNSGLIKSCTMKGESHDELHKWLHPHMALIEQLKEAGNQEVANQIIQKIDESFNQFHQYFQ